MHHAIEYTTADTRFHFLSTPTSGTEPRREDALETENAGFRQTPSMISTLSFPTFTPLPSDGLHPLVTGLNRSVAPFRLSFSRIPTRRNHRLNRPLLIGRIGQKIMNRPPIIAAIRPSSLTSFPHQHPQRLLSRPRILHLALDGPAALVERDQGIARSQLQPPSKSVPIQHAPDPYP